MAISKDYEIARIEINPATADASVLFNLVIVDTGTIVSSRHHRVSVPASVALNQIAAQVNASLTAAGYPMLAVADSTSVGAILNAARGNLAKAVLPRNAL
jgi:hypothetical protein